MSRTVSLDVHLGYVSVNVDMEDIDTDDLIDELKRRNQAVYDDGDIPESITEMFYAFKLGQIQRATELAKKIAQDHTGRIL